MADKPAADQTGKDKSRQSGSDPSGARSHRVSTSGHELEGANVPASNAATSSASQGSRSTSSNSLLFLNYSSPSEFKSRSNKRIVKRWASTSGHRSSQLLSELTSNDENIAPSSGNQGHGSASARAAPDAEKHVATTRASGAPDSQVKRSPPNISDRSGSDRSGAKSSRRKSQKRGGSSSSDEPRALRKLLPASLTNVEVVRSPSPLSDIQKVARDPFDVLPVQADAHAHELLRLYLNAQLLSPSWNQLQDGQGEFKRSLVESRKSVWFPLVRDSTAAFAALVTFIETTPGLSQPTQHRGFVEKYQGLALRKANEELASPQTATNDSTLFAIVLLMISSQRVNDLPTFRIHARGLSLLLQQRRNDRQHHHHGPLTEFIHCFDASDFALNARARLASKRNPYDPRDPLILRATSPEKERTDDFYALHSLGLITAPTAYFFAFAVTLLALGIEAQDDHLAASSTAQHIFIEAVTPLPATSPLEVACYAAVRLVLHCLVLPSRPDDDGITVMCAGAMAQGVFTHGIESLLAQAPATLLWLALVGGSQAKCEMMAPLRVGFLGGARGARAALMARAQIGGSEGGSSTTEFDCVLALVEERFLWAPTMDGDASAFWGEVMALEG